MAEIRVEPRKKAPIWPWIVGLILLLGIVWIVVDSLDSEEEYDENDTEEILEESEEVGKADTFYLQLAEEAYIVA